MGKWKDLIGNAGLGKQYAQLLAAAVTNVCVRNTVLEEYHARGSLSQDDMKKLNKEVINKVYTYFFINSYGTTEQQKAMAQLFGLYTPVGWDEPEFDEDIMESINMVIKDENLLNNIFKNTRLTDRMTDNADNPT